MTESEAIDIINNYKFDFRRFGTFKMIEALSVATKSLEEIQKYRAIGTVEECRAAIDWSQWSNKLEVRKVIDEKKLIEDIVAGMANSNLVQADTLKQVLCLINSQPKIGEWIPCKKRLPEEKINPITRDFYEYQVTFQSENVRDIRHYKFGRGHWWNGSGIMDEYVIAWRQNIEPYHEEKTEAGI